MPPPPKVTERLDKVRGSAFRTGVLTSHQVKQAIERQNVFVVTAEWFAASLARLKRQPEQPYMHRNSGVHVPQTVVCPLPPPCMQGVDWRRLEGCAPCTPLDLHPMGCLCKVCPSPRSSHSLTRPMMANSHALFWAWQAHVASPTLSEGALGHAGRKESCAMVSVTCLRVHRVLNAQSPATGAGDSALATSDSGIFERCQHPANHPPLQTSVPPCRMLHRRQAQGFQMGNANPAAPAAHNLGNCNGTVELFPL